jgi:hypothetical protein
MASDDGSFLLRRDLGFLSERGIIQGGTESALSWIALYDMLLCVVNEPDGDAIREAILAYADDLMSITSSAAAQQVIADRMSAFCCFAGMEIATNKTEYVAINGPRAPPSLRVHGLRWDETIVPCVYGKDSVKYLGISLPVDGDERQSLAWAASMLSTTLKQLEMRAAPLSCKVYVAAAQIIPTVMYRATKAPWTLAQYRSLDRIISSFYRRIFKVERTFPEALIYMSPKDCGLGMKRFSDDAQRLKWSAIQRLLTSGGTPA